MKYLKLLLAAIFSSIFLCGCYEGTEPNNIAYITAMGIDQGENNDIELTIQFAKPTQISGGASEEGGKGGEIIENMVVQAPTIYAGINIANHMLSKEFSMAHMKLFVLSREICEGGVEDILETMARSEEVRPNIYMAVAQGTAREYLEAVKPVVEINPVKYYQLVFEKNNFGSIPRNTNHDFYFYYNTMERNNVLPLAGVAQLEEKESSGGQSGQEENASKGGSSEASGEKKEKSEPGGSSGGGSGESGSSGSNTSMDDKTGENLLQPEAPVNYENFEFRIKDYTAGQVGIERTNRSEIMGMAVFREDKMVGTMGSIESVLYNMISGVYEYGYITFKEPDSGEPITIYVEQEKKPKIRYDKHLEKAYVELFLEGDLASLSAQSLLEHNIAPFQEQAAKDIEEAAEKFLYRTSREFNADIVGIGNTVKKKFWTYQKYKEYDWEHRYQSIDFEVKVNFTIRRTGLTIRTEE